MEAIVCEKCGSSKMVEKDGYLVCENCGTKFVSPTGSKADILEQKKKLLTLADRCVQASNPDEAYNYYKQVQELDPNDWEAPFFMTMIPAIKSAAVNDLIGASKGVQKAVEVASTILFGEGQTEETRQKALDRIIAVTKAVCGKMHTTAYTIKGIDSSYAANQHFIDNCKEIALAYTACGMYMGGLDKDYLDSRNKEAIVDVLKTAIKVISSASSLSIDGMQTVVNSISDEIRKYEPEYQTPTMQKFGESAPGVKSSGCYIATCVYGSYDCPSVWVLRRFRDIRLANSFLGRAFIRFYYATSPRLVKLLGNRQWFKRLWKSLLDPFVAKLEHNGYSHDPYQD